MATQSPPHSPTKLSLERQRSTTRPDPEASELPSHEGVTERDRQRGIVSIEAFHQTFGQNKLVMWIFYIAIGIFLFATTFQGSTSYYYQTYAVSEFQNHGQLLGIIFTVTPIIQAVTQPFIAKICDVWSRPVGFTMSTILSVIGFIIMPAAQSGYAFAAGAIIGAVGTAGITLCTTILLADISPLEWRSLANGLASLWYLVTPWIGANIANQVGLTNWRWGYGMFTIIIPVSMAPIIAFLFWGEYRAVRSGALDLKKNSLMSNRTLMSAIYWFIEELDLFALLLLAISWVLVFLPFSLASSAKGGWSNPSMIAMIVCGVVIFVLFGLWEAYGAKKPMVNRRIVLNSVFLLGVGIDFFYYFTGYLRDTYYLTYVLIVKDWTTTQWTNFGQTFTVAICGFSIILGFIMRYTHRYKYLQVSGLVIRMIGLGITVLGVDKRIPSTTLLVFQQIVIGLGSACSVLGTQVATQGSVPHQDMAQTIAQLSLWTQLGGSVGSAITAAVWTETLPSNMAKAGVPVEQIAELYTSPVSITLLEYASPLRQACIDAFNMTVRPLFIAATAVSTICLLCGIFMPDYYLGKEHNKIEKTDIAGRSVKDSERQ